ncbi:MAG: TonB-dependent receptor domain-containing protein, partial [Acidobacteriota bacterium]
MLKRAVVGLLLWSPGLAFAQTSTATITGVVRDQSGAVLQSVEVTATRTETGEGRAVLTAENGIYRFLNIPPGIYTVRAVLTGFKTAVDTDLEVTVGEVKRVDLTLSVGTITEDLIVQAESTAVNIDEGRLSQLVNSFEVRDLPLNGRNAYQLAQLGPGVFPTLGVTAQDSTSNAGFSFVVNGQRHRGNNFLMDGTDNNYVGIGGIPSVTPQVDIIEEFRVATNNFSAEYGRNAGSIVNVLTKSGTNDFHGTVYEFHRNDALDAREWFDSEKPPLIQHTFGFTVGGPIVKERTFFFGGYEGFRETSGETIQHTVETRQLLDFVDQERAGTLAALLFQRFPLTRPAPSSGEDIGSPAPGPETTGPRDGIPDQGDLSLFGATRTETDQWNLRIDHVFSENDKLYGRFTRELKDFPPTIVRPSVDSVGTVTDQAATVSETHVFSPTVVNEFRVGWNEKEPNGDVQEGTFDIPSIRISGFSPGFGAAGNVPTFFARHTYQLTNSLSWAQGNHWLKLGFEFRHNQENSDFPGPARGNYRFSDILDFIDDEPYSQRNLVDADGAPIGTPRHFRVNEWALFVQDDIKVKPNFTLNLGLRYENFRPPYEKDAIQTNISVGSGSNLFERYRDSVIVRVPEGQDVYDPDNNNLAPRVGFAWDPTGAGLWSVRGGYGISYNRIFMNITSNIKFNPPFARSVTANTSNRLPISYTIPTTLDPGLISGFTPPRVNPNFLDPDLATTYVHSIFFGIQRELFDDWLLEANYVSTLGRKLYTQESYNRFTGDLLDGVEDRLNPAWRDDDFLTASINQAYHSGQFSVTKRFRGGLGF